MEKYKEQIERVRRYYQRFKNLNDGIEFTMPSEMYIDDIYSFFQNCYHLKDWLKNDNTYTKHTNQEIKDESTLKRSGRIKENTCIIR